MPERIRYSISAPPADILTVLTYSYGPKMTCCENINHTIVFSFAASKYFYFQYL